MTFTVEVGANVVVVNIDAVVVVADVGVERVLDLNVNGEVLALFENILIDSVEGISSNSFVAKENLKWTSFCFCLNLLSFSTNSSTRLWSMLCLFRTTGRSIICSFLVFSTVGIRIF